MNDLSIYKECAPLMETGDSILYVGDETLADAIGWWTKNILRSQANIIFTHGNMVLRFKEFETFIPAKMTQKAEYLDANRRWVFNAQAGGVFPIYLSTYLENYKGSAWWYPLKKDIPPPVRENIGACAMTLAGTGYDFVGLLKNAVGLVSANMKKLFCTEAIFISYRDGGGIVQGDKAPRPDMVPALGVFEKPVKLF